MFNLGATTPARSTADPVVTDCATTDVMAEILSKSRDEGHGGGDNNTTRQQDMTGFEPTFVDIVDYILRTTHWIWNEKKVELCHDYYSKDCLVHTLTGDLVGNQAVADDLNDTLTVFPDWAMDGENVIWDLEKKAATTTNITPPTYYCSQLIVSRMTHKGASESPVFNEYGKPSYAKARIRTIADCVIRENEIVEEWLVRDTSFLLQSLRLNVRSVARNQAREDMKRSQRSKDPVPHLVDRLEMDRERVQSNNMLNLSPSKRTLSSMPLPADDPQAYVHLLMNVIWKNTDEKKPGLVKLDDMYDHRVSVHMPGGRELYGHVELKEYLYKYLQKGLSNVSVSIDHVSCIPYLSGGGKSGQSQAVDIAVRWTLTSTHSGRHALLGSPTKRHIYLMAASHFRIVCGHRIREEWTVWDEVALLRQAETQRLLLIEEMGSENVGLDRAIIFLIVAVAVFAKLKLDGWVFTEWLESL